VDEAALLSIIMLTLLVVIPLLLGKKASLHMVRYPKMLNAIPGLIQRPYPSSSVDQVLILL